MQTVQIRLTKQQLKLIDAKVKAGIYPSRSEAIRDYVRRAELLELFSRFFDVTEDTFVSSEQLRRARKQVYQKFIKPKLKKQGPAT